jgi:hypothetical protein
VQLIGKYSTFQKRRIGSMKTKVFDKVRVCCLFVMILSVMALGLSGCGGKSAVAKRQKPSQHPGANIQASIDRLYAAIQLNSDGTVSLNERSAGFQSLKSADKAFGTVLLAALNEKIKKGLVRINDDFSVEWAGTKPPAGKPVKGTNCKTKFWGEQCDVDPSTTKKVCEGLEAGEGALLICSAIPVADTVCAIIEVVGSIPLEAEICPCANRGDGSTFHVTCN